MVYKIPKLLDAFRIHTIQSDAPRMHVIKRAEDLPEGFLFVLGLILQIL